MPEIRKPADYSPERDGTALFYFTDDPCFPCFPRGTTWNGFDNVRVSPQVRDLIAQHWEESADIDGLAPRDIADLRASQPDADGLIDLSNGYATRLELTILTFNGEQLAFIAGAIEVGAEGDDTIAYEEAMALAKALQSGNPVLIQIADVPSGDERPVYTDTRGIKRW